MTSHGSQQLRLFRRAFHLDGHAIEIAAQISGLGLAEARMWARDDAITPPPPEAFELLGNHSTPFPVCAGNGQPEETTVARAARKARDDDGEVKVKDFGTAVKIFRTDIKPALSKAGEFNQEASTAYKAVKKQCHIQPGAAKAAFKLVEMEDAKREDWLRSFNGTLKAAGIDPSPADLVDMAQGSGPAPLVAKPTMQLVTLASDGSETDLGDAGEEVAAGEQEGD